MSTTTKTPAATVRAALKSEMGLNSRQVSVRAKSTGSLRVVIKDAAADAAKVTEIAERVEKIDRCNYTGEILSGGNTFVFVEYSRELLESWDALHTDAVAKACAELESLGKDSNRLVEIEGTDTLVGWACNRFSFQLWHGSSAKMHFGQPEHAGRYVESYKRNGVL